jgi:hypothetical protein
MLQIEHFRVVLGQPHFSQRTREMGHPLMHFYTKISPGRAVNVREARVF